MKKRLFILLTLTALAGCSGKIDTAKVRASLSSLDSAHQAQLETALADIDAGKFKEAEVPLRQIAFGVKLDKNQIEVLKNTLAKVEAKAGKE